MFKFGYEYAKDESYCPEMIGELYIFEAYIPKHLILKCPGDCLQLGNRGELRHAVGGVAAHTLRYFSNNKEGFNVFRARGQAVWWLRHIYNSFKWWRAYNVNAEGERKDMPMLYVGETFGAGTSYYGREADVAVSAFENDQGIINTADTGGTVFAVGYSEHGGLFNSPDKYAAKTIVSNKYSGAGVNVIYPVRKNLRLMAEHILKIDKKPLNDSNINDEIKKIRVVILERERHGGLIAEIRKAGAQLTLVQEDDLCPAFALERDEADFITGVGGVPEGVLSAMLVEKLGGEMTFRLLPDKVANCEALLCKLKNWDKFTLEEIEILKNFHIVKPGEEGKSEAPFNKIFTSHDLARGHDMVFTASVIKKTPWIKDENGNEAPGVSIDLETGDLVVHTVRIADNGVEIVPIIYKTAINKFKNDLRHCFTPDEHSNLHIELAKIYAEFGLFELADKSIAKAMHDIGVTEDHRKKYRRVMEYIKGLEFLTVDKPKALELAIEHFDIASRIDDDNREGIRPKRMVKRIYEYMGDRYSHMNEVNHAVRKYKKALQFGPHELKLYRKINTLNMKPILNAYFDIVNNEYAAGQKRSDKEWDAFKLESALRIYYERLVSPALVNGDPWLIFFRRTVLHNMKLSYKLAMLLKLKILLNELNTAEDDDLRVFLNKEFKIDDDDSCHVIDYRNNRERMYSCSELYYIKRLKMSSLVKLLYPRVKVASHNELETADIPLSISIREAVERRYKNILQELKDNFKDEAQEHSYAVGEAYHYVGMALYDVGDNSGARIYYGKAIRRFREIIEKFEGITPVNAQYRIGNLFEEMALLFLERKEYYYQKAKNEYNKIVDEKTAVKLFSSAYKLNTVRIEQATERVKELNNALSNGKAFHNYYSLRQFEQCGSGI